MFRVSDEVQWIYRGFGLDLAKANGDDSWTLPMPARFVVDRAGVIQYVDCNEDARLVPDFNKVKAKLAELK